MSANSERWRQALVEALANPVSDEPTDDASIVREVLANIEGWYLRPDDWSNPYGPMFTIGNRRSKIPFDLTPDQVAVLRAIAPHLPTRQARIQALDAVALRADGRERFDAYLTMVTAVADGLDVIELQRDDIDQCERALNVALKFKGTVGAQGQRIEDALLARLRTSSVVSEAVSISDLFLKYGRARAQAASIASQFRQWSQHESLGVARTLREAATNWHYTADDAAAAFDDTAWIVDNLIEEAQALLESGERNAPLIASDAFENALKTLRTIPKAERVRRGHERTDERIKAGIDAANAQALSMLTALNGETTDVTQVANRVRDTMRGRPIEEAVHILLRPTRLIDYGELKSAAEQALRGSVVDMFPTIHLATDGRIAAHTNRRPDDLIYGVPGDVWQLMMEIHQRHLDLLVAGRIVPAWQSMRNDHRLRTADFHALTRYSPIVPAGREYSIAQALAYGYNGDFFTAAQLLAPQVENLVRVHLANAGALTRSYDDGIQNEIGLSALMERPEATAVLGDDVSFEIRALFCSPLGPNLRNEYAHGLVGDWGAGTRVAVYAWWLVWKLVDEHFVNSHHDLPATNAREPSAPEIPSNEATAGSGSD
ncbi:DUF4209 domain-containing protein [Microbacterium maritypicum]|uniref:DUF4209 domain-containing protein n=1 Tax=Microbacterium maritypicum TaxID=33918 RepID=UPI001B32F60E|nr:DUF4209 domain-containing protein [Microbacterium liquefaciens]MBP5801290.1 DUF4209 domain-containing protein [Microbacterium liquefaciens]